MAFDLASFERAEFIPRTKEVEVPALSDFFDEGEDSVWEVRGLNSNELHKAINAGQMRASIDGILRAVAENQDQTTAIRKAIGLTKDTPGEVAKRLEMIVVGSVKPEITLPIAVKLAETYPIEFLSITNEITNLTGQGFDHVKPKAALQKISS